ncbi:MAG: single-stranded-DNA-specific exonuclease RecJ [Acidobacteriota bacterium]|jgi:single-stranded-DNA-specific exonuclease|nr:MAG: single-stranded-DNA-specific exonuclease RecJ [Acidobacteriota bacterium]
MVHRIWEDVPADAAAADRIAAALGLPPVIARLLCQRGFTTPESAERFLAPDLSQLHDPFLLVDMRPAVDRLLAAIARQESIVIHGDYDVDGITATVILRRALELLGATVGHFVPDRIRDGYGLQPAGIERLHAAGARVIVSVDCGIRAAEAAARARELGVDLIITDHHEPEGALPPALAVINPKRADCGYPEKALAGVGVALKLVQALFAAAGRGGDTLPAFVKMAAIGTLADVVPLVGENRVIASCGLQGLTRGPHAPGLEALLDESGLLGRTLDSFHVGFVLAPRLNAAGRMSSPDLALDLLLLRGRDDSTRTLARELARRLCEENTRRQEQEAEILAAARRTIEKDPHVGAQNILIVAGEGWHRGVIGIVASKLVELYHRPTLVLSIEDGLARGSGRSIPSFDLLAALETCADVFLQFGGHRQAAGVTLEAARIGELRDRLCRCANERLGPEDLIPRLRIDAELGLREISSDVVRHLGRLGPFGAANPKPVFRAAPVELIAPPKKLKERHLALLVRQAGRAFRAMAWRAADREAYLSANRSGLELAYSLGESEYRGERTTELTVADIRVPAGARA